MLPSVGAPFEDERRLAGVIEHQAGEHHAVPGEADRPGAEMAHVGVERLGAGDAQEHAAEHEEPGEAAGGEETRRRKSD